MRFPNAFASRGIRWSHRIYAFRLLEYFAKSFLGPTDQTWTPSITIPQKAIEVVRFVDQELVRQLSNQPRDLYCLSPRKFEEFDGELGGPTTL